MKHKDEHSVEQMCRVLGTNKSGYYKFKCNPLSKRIMEEEKLLPEIKRIYDESRGVYGSPRITASLNKNGIKCSRPRVARLMKKNGIQSRIRKSYKKTTNSSRGLKTAADLLNQNFTVNAPDTVYVSDITYIRTYEGWLYLTVIIDLFNREVISHYKSKTLFAKDTTIPALMQAVKKRKPGNGLIFHSDKGVQYSCKDFRELMETYGIAQSMSAKCYDNAPSESFFKTLKSELIYLKKGGYLTRKEAETEIFEYIECFYNTKRLHSFISYMSPKNYMGSFAAACRYK